MNRFLAFCLVCIFFNFSVLPDLWALAPSRVHVKKDILRLFAQKSFSTKERIRATLTNATETLGNLQQHFQQFPVQSNLISRESLNKEYPTDQEFFLDLIASLEISLSKMQDAFREHGQGSPVLSPRPVGSQTLNKLLGMTDDMASLSGWSHYLNTALNSFADDGDDTRKNMIRQLDQSVKTLLQNLREYERERSEDLIETFDLDFQTKITCQSEKFRILIVDDTLTGKIPVQRVLIALLQLTKGTPNIVLAADGQEAVNVATKTHFDLIYMDHDMPVMNGAEASRQILQYYRESKPAVKAPLIVGMTADTAGSNHKNFWAQGVRVFTPKPVKKADLARVFIDHFQFEDEIQSSLNALLGISA